MKRAALLLIIVTAIFACKTVPTEIPEDLSQAELIQLAQESADAENWEAALAYYTAIQDRYPADRNAAVTSRYEIAFIEYKRGNLEAAQSGFEALLGLYDFQGDSLPQWPRVLAQSLLEQIAVETAALETDASTAAE